MYDYNVVLKTKKNMNVKLMKLVAKLLRDVADKFDGGTSEISEEQALDIINILTHEILSKECACEYLNLSRSRFDDLIRLGIIPKGRKRKGFKELVWYKDELQNVVRSNQHL